MPVIVLKHDTFIIEYLHLEEVREKCSVDLYCKQLISRVQSDVTSVTEKGNHLNSVGGFSPWG
jgi:hypothetical protein